MAVQIDLTTLSGYESLPAGIYALGVKAKAAGYTDSDLSQTVSFTKLAAPVATAADTTVSWDAITNAASYDVYVDGELYENTAGGATSYTLEAGTYKWVDSPVMPSVSFDISNISAKYYYLTTNNTYSNTADLSNYFVINSNSISIGDVAEGIYTNYYVGNGWYTRNQDDDESYTATDTNKLRTIIVNADFEVTADFYNWAITGGNLVKQTGETWVLNEFPDFHSAVDVEIPFSSANNSYTRIIVDNVDDRLVYDYDIAYGGGGGWLDQTYRTITFATSPTGTLLTWLQANGTKQ